MVMEVACPIPRCSYVTYSPSLDDVTAYLEDIGFMVIASGAGPSSIKIYACARYGGYGLCPTFTMLDAKSMQH
jgi:hypothetical protein